MGTENMDNIVPSSCKDVEEDGAPLPGFRFHPTDGELVGFYLKKKVEKMPIRIELIKQIDIYKYDPWDLPRGSNVGEKEWYFYCKRGRKYRNSIRPNRVTGSGFWKATGIDKPIYSNNGEGRECIGLKKSLVYYRGSAGKGSKTDWMMHEFRLPADHDLKNNSRIDANTIAQEAEVWTLCRILKRNVTQKKCMPDWKEISTKKNPQPTTASSKTNSLNSDYLNNNDVSSRQTNYISFTTTNNPMIWQNNVKINGGLSTNHERKPLITSDYQHHQDDLTNYDISLHHDQTPSTSYPSSFMSCTPEVNELSKNHGADYWDELKSVVDFASNNPFIL